MDTSLPPSEQVTPQSVNIFTPQHKKGAIMCNTTPNNWSPAATSSQNNPKGVASAASKVNPSTSSKAHPALSHFTKRMQSAHSHAGRLKS